MPLFALLAFMGRPVPIDEPPLPERPIVRRAPSTWVAVAHFADLGPSTGHDYLATGLSEEILSRLATLRDLNVVARPTPLTMTADLDFEAVRRELGVGLVLGGSVRVQGDRVRIAATLVRTGDGLPLWSDTFDGSLTDIFAIQDEIATAASRALVRAIATTDPVRTKRSHVPDSEAYEHFLRGVYAQSRRTQQDADRSIAHLERAVALDPEFADALAELARSLALYAFYVREDPEQWTALVERAEPLARRAVALAPESAPARLALAGVLRRSFDWTGGLEQLQLATQLAPSYSAAFEELGAMLAQLERLEESRDAFVRALAADPLSPLAHRQVGRAYLFLGELDRAVEHLVEALRLEPNDDDAPRLLWNVYWEQGRELEAGEVFIRRYPWPMRAPTRIALRLLGMRRLVDLQYRFRRWQTGDACLGAAYDGAGMLAAAGRADEMFECLDRAPVRTLSYFNVEPVYAPYRDDPRFEFIRRKTQRPLPQRPLGAQAAH